MTEQPVSPSSHDDGIEQKQSPSQKKATISRRSFLMTTAIAATALGGVGVAGALTGEKHLLRPPGGQNETHFIAECNRCERCVNICHTKAIGIASLSDGIVNARTPIMRFNLGACDFCGDCVEVCPTGALVPFNVEAARSGDVDAACIGIAQLNPAICLSYVSDSCNLCYSECPYDAVALDELGNPVVIEQNCNGCGVCEYVCPVLSLRSYIGGNQRAITVEYIDSDSKAR